MAAIAVIGSGAIGSTIGEAWRRAGHQVTYGSRSPEPPATAPINQAIASAEVVLLAIPGAGIPELLAAHGPELAGRLVIDATNDVRADRWHHAEAYTASAPDARFARAFNTLGYELFAEPTIGGEQTDLFWCGPDDADVEQLIADVGLRPIRVGDIDKIDVVDGIAHLWITLVFQQGMPRRLAFRLVSD